MKNRSMILLLFLFAFAVFPLSGFGEAIPINDPHIEPAKCNSCHNREMKPEEKASGEDILLAGSVDETCHICHPYDCCRINSLKGHNHPSNVDKWDVDNFTEPEKLPLFDGMITCLTCHYHRRVDMDSKGYRMVRLVKVKLDSVDWTDLCLNCHVGY